MKCQYRNCETEVEGRPNKKFCCIQHKRNEQKYLKRKRDKQKKLAAINEM